MFGVMGMKEAGVVNEIMTLLEGPLFILEKEFHVGLRKYLKFASLFDPYKVV